MLGIDKVYYPFTVASGHSLNVVLRITGRGTITKLMVAQVTGALEGFEYTLYNAEAACPPGDDMVQDPAIAAEYPEILYRVVGPITVASGQNHFDSNGAWPDSGIFNCFIPYHNKDNRTTGTPVGDPSNTVDQLYLQIKAKGTDDTIPKQFGVAITTSNWNLQR